MKSLTHFDSFETLWTSTHVSTDQSHHVCDGRPLYSARFYRVLKFHAPGLAAVEDATGCYHIKPDGQPAYAVRFEGTFGFYDERAAVYDSSGRFHIGISGEAVYSERYTWCGNFQEGLVPVRTLAGYYFHLDREGKRTYGEQYLYAGDYRDGVACVRRMDGLCVHIDQHGKQIHSFAGLDLDVFHKSFSRARDKGGWFHLRKDGTPAYSARFSEVEPFYNGQAYCRDWSGTRLVIDEKGKVIHTVWEPSHQAQRSNAGRKIRVVVVVGNCGSGKTTLARSLGYRLRIPVLSIDDFRRTASDGSPAGEVRAWQQFLESAAQSSATGAVIEFSGSGHMAHLVRLTLEEHADYQVIWLQVPPGECLRRVANRTTDVPYPPFGVTVETLIPKLHERLQKEMARGEIWPNERIQKVNGDSKPDEVLALALKLLGESNGHT